MKASYGFVHETGFLQSVYWICPCLKSSMLEVYAYVGDRNNQEKKKRTFTNVAIDL